MRKLLALVLALLPFAAIAQVTPPTPTYTGVIFSPQGSMPTPAAEGKCWSQTDGLHCYYSGAAHGPFSTSSGTVSTTGSPASGNLSKFSGATTITNGDLSGDATTSGTLAVTVAKINGATLGTTTPTSGNLLIGSGTTWVTHAMSGDATITSGGAITLATVNSNVGTFGDGTNVATITVNAKGLITAASSTPITGAPPSGAASGDLSGTFPGPTVAKINGVTLGTVTATSGNDLVANGTQWVSVSTSGDCTRASSGAITCTKTNGVNFATSATTDTTNASNISSGTLAAARGGAGTINGALKGNGSGVVSQAACADLSNGATGCSTATGTSGATIPLLNAANTWSNSQAGSVTTLSISGSTFTPDASNNHYKITLVHASCPCTLANPSPNFVAGTTGVIEIVQSATGSDTIGTYGTSYLAPSGTSSIALSTSANAIDVFAYFVIDSTHILLIPSYNYSH